MDADQFGAIVLDLRAGEYRGQTRAGEVRWRLPAEAAGALVACLIRCPDAVLSGNAAAMNSPDQPDPPPQSIVDGERRTVTPTVAVKLQVLAAGGRVAGGGTVGAVDLVLAGGDRAGGWWVQLQHGAATLRVPVGSYRTTWQTSADNRWALAITQLDGGQVPARAEARWFARNATGWWPSGDPVPVAAAASCVSPDGDHAILLGAAPTVLTRAESSTLIRSQASPVPRPVTDLRYASACGFAAVGGIIAEYGQQPSGVQTRLRVVDRTQTVVWQGRADGEAAVTADPTAPRVAYVSGRTLREVDPRTGAPGRVVPDVLSARYDRAGELVVVRADGQLSWLP